jgi:hypothetical protein
MWQESSKSDDEFVPLARYRQITITAILERTDSPFYPRMSAIGT